MTVPTVVTLNDFTSHLNLSGDDDSALQLQIDAATQVVCDYIVDRQPVDDDWISEIEGWDVDSAPPVIKMAVLTQAAEFYRFRGDDLASDKPPSGDGSDLSPIVKRLLHRYRSPSLA